MANCTKKTETVTVVRIKEVILELSEAEAKTLSQLLAKIGGYDKETGHRSRLDAILQSLRVAGINSDLSLPAIGVGRIYRVEGVQSCTIVDSND